MKQLNSMATAYTSSAKITFAIVNNTVTTEAPAKQVKVVATIFLFRDYLVD